MASISEIPEVRLLSSSVAFVFHSPSDPFSRVPHFRLHFQNLKGNMIIPLENKFSMVCLGPMGNPNPTSIINLETSRITLKSSNIRRLDSSLQILAEHYSWMEKLVP